MQHPNIWPPFTQVKNAPDPIFITHGKGALLFDKAGRSYVDAISSWWTNIHGHAHPYIAEKIYEQANTLEHVIFAGFSHAQAERLAERLVRDHLPHNIQKIFFSDNGSTAVEVGIKMAIQYWQNIGQKRHKIIAFEHAYHGDTFGSMSVSERGPFTGAFHDMLFDVQFVQAPFPGKEKEAIAAFAACADGDTAAFLFEPCILGAGGMLMYAAEALDEMIRIARDKKILCIADEVMTGFYRSGHFFATDACTHKPDIYCLSKGLTGGTMAMGITACASYIYDAFYSDDKFKALFHGHSFTANPLACAAANASLDILEQAETKQNIRRIAERHTAFAHLLKEQSLYENVRQCGTVLAFDVVTGSGTDYFNTIRNTLYAFFMERGILLRPLGNTLYIMPPYCIRDEELDAVYASILALPAYLAERSLNPS